MNAWALALLVGLTGCNTLQLGERLRVGPADWPTAGGSAARSNAAEANLMPPLEQAWRYDADAGFGAAPAVAADGVLMVATRKGEIHGIDIESGRKRGVETAKEPITGAPVLASRTLYAPIAAGKRTIIAHDIENGGRRWALRAGPHEAGLLLEGNTLVAAGLDGTVRALEATTGTIRWTVTPDSTAGFFAAPVLIVPNHIVVADDRGRITALDLASGRVVWTQELEAPVYESPAVGSDRLYVPTTRGTLAAYNVHGDGSQAWVYRAEHPTVRLSTPAVHDGLVVFGGSDGQLRAVDVASGVLQWSFTSDGNFASAPLIAGNVVYAGAMDETLYALDLASGEMLWKHTLDGRIKSAPILHRGHLIVLAEPKYVYAFTVSSPVAAIPPSP